MRVRIVAVAVASALVAALAGGCSGGGGDERAEPKSTVLVPGRPGEPNKTEVRGPAAAKPPTADEIRYIQMMIPHHRQALEMSALAPGRASSAQVKTLAERIHLAQQGEIKLMETWLKDNAKAVNSAGGGHGGHGAPSPAASGHAGMPGMATPQQMQQLKGAKGEAFDRLFLTLMINHHQGAITMTKPALGRGENAIAQQLMRDIMAGQQGEINRMRDLLKGL